MSSELVLAIDNSLDFLNLALAADGRLIEERHCRPSRPSSEVLPLLVSALLDSHGCSPRDLSLLVVSLGPGSFTGIRVALAFAKGVSSAVGLPLVGVPTLDVLARPLVGVTSSSICPLVDAKKGEVFFAQYQVEKGTLRRMTDYEAAGPEDVARKLVRPTLVFGSGVRLCEPVLSGLEGITLVTDGHQRILGESLLRLGTERYREGAPGVVKPVYGRKSEAEIKFHLTVT